MQKQSESTAWPLMQKKNLLFWVGGALGMAPWVWRYRYLAIAPPRAANASIRRVTSGDSRSGGA